MSQIKVGEYLFSRLKELGIKTCFGVPGDYELALLDLFDDVGIKFSGNPNELIASYAADGYARLNGVGAWVDTFGPGELSSYCGHAGAYTEFVPVAHIVGYPGRDAMANHTIMHHSLGTGEFGMYERMARYISCATTVLMDPKTAPAEIDRCFSTMLMESRPVYIGVPVDMSHLMCDGSALKTPLERSLPPNVPTKEQGMVQSLRSLLETKKSPIFIVDGNAGRNNWQDECSKLSKLTGLPTFTTVMGKGATDEDAPSFGGVYTGAGTPDEVRKAIESTDCVFWIGNFPSDFNTGEFTNNVPADVTVDFQRFFIKIGDVKHELKSVHVLRSLIKSLEDTPLARTSTTKVTWDPYPNRPEKGSSLSQDYLWSAMSTLFRPGDFVITETGTSAFGTAASKLPSGAGMYNQTIFGSIGYATGAATGAFQSIKETGKYKRCILITGEGSLQLTAQTFADMLKLRLNPIIFVLNNGGYTVERLIHGKEAAYNTLPERDYGGLAKVFGPEHPSKYWGPVDTAKKLDKVLADPELNDGEYFRLVELKLGYLDAPTLVKKAGAAVEAFNKKQ